MHTIVRDPLKDLARALGVDHWELVDAVMRSNTFISYPASQDAYKKKIDELTLENQLLKEKLLKLA